MKPSDWISGRRQRWLLIAGIVAFVWFLQWAYINWLSPTFAYYGFEYYAPPVKYLALAWILSVVPGIWMPLEIIRPSQVCYWILYLTVFVPSMFIPLFIALNRPSDTAALMLTLFIGFAICGTGYLIPLHSFRFFHVTRLRFWRGFCVLVIVCVACVLIIFRGNIHLVSFADIYELRDASADLGGTLSTYPLMWLYGAIDPFLLGYGLFYKKPWIFLVGALGQVLVYSCFGTKASLLSIVFVLGIYCLLRIRKFPFALNFTWSIVILFGVLCLSLLNSGGEPSALLVVVLFLVFFRSFGLAGLLTGQYHYFIQHNPLTYYSHIKGISSLIHYPFQYPLGTEVGYYFYFPLVDTTAHFWATDGLAALGLPGIIVASIVCAFVFWLLDSVGKKHNPRFVALVIFYATYSLANLSLFTTMLSGGLGLLILLLYLIPTEADTKFQPARDTAKQDIPSTCSGRELPEPG